MRQSSQWAIGKKVTIGVINRGALFPIVLPAAFALLFFMLNLVSRTALTP